MLDFLFGFGLRLGRLHYFLCGLVLAVVMTVVAFAIAAHAFDHTARGVAPSMDLIVGPALVAVAVFLWLTFNLQAMRVRDIGWDPVCVMSAWLAIIVLDAVLAGKVPAWSLGTGKHETIVGGLINLAFTGVLLFWPSGERDQPTPIEPRETHVGPDRGGRRGSVPAARLAAVTKADLGRRY